MIRSEIKAFMNIGKPRGKPWKTLKKELLKSKGVMKEYKKLSLKAKKKLTKKFLITDKELQKLVREREIQECWHEWQILEKQTDSFDNLLGIVIFCNKCGKIEKKKI